MELNNSNINDFINRYINFVNHINDQFHYPSNITHVLYLIVPAFIVKYGIKEERTILKCFEEVPIYINSSTNKVLTAFFNRRMCYKEENGVINYYTQKEIVLNDYYGNSLLELIDNLIHEFNHAVNSIINEVSWDDKKVTMRTGLSYITFDRKNLSQAIKRSKDITLEEIINTKQTEDIINIINSFNNYQITNHEFNNALYTLKHDIDAGGYKSKAYFLQSYICKELMKNKTFIPTVENLRFKGNVSDIEEWFDNITGIKGSYKKLTTLLEEILKEDSSLYKTKFFKKYKINKIMAKSREVLDIVNIFDNNCIYK